jgi:hypothetical protein
VWCSSTVTGTDNIQSSSGPIAMQIQSPSREFAQKLFQTTVDENEIVKALTGTANNDCANVPGVP